MELMCLRYHLDKIQKPEEFWFLDGDNMLKLWFVRTSTPVVALHLIH